MSLSLIWITALILVGFALLLIELLIVPGSTLVGIIGFIAIGLGVYSCFAAFGNIAGLVCLGSTLIASLLLIILILRSKTWKKVSLADELRGKSSVNVGMNELDIKIGTLGICVSRLAPMGTVDFKGHYLEVCSSVELVDAGTEVRITKIEGDKIYVVKV